MAKQTSLAAQSGALQHSETKLPAIFGGPAEDIKAKDWGTYVCFAHAKRADEYRRIVQAIGRAPDDHDMFLMEAKTVTPLPVMKCTILKLQQRWVRTVEKNGVFEPAEVSAVEMPSPFAEVIDAAILVYLSDRIVPATIECRKAKCSGMVTINDALHLASTNEWASKGELYKQTLQLQQPFWRFYAKYEVLPPRPPKGGGYPYRPTRADVFPTGPDEWKLIATFNQDPESVALMNKCAERFAFRAAKLDALMKAS